MSNLAHYQTTIRKPVSVSGFGFWNGRDVNVEFQPAAENHGLVFVRSDLPGRPEIPAVVHNRVDGPRRTTLVHQGCAVELVEHVLAALAGLRISNCRIVVDKQELPGCDGSSLEFVNALLAAGIEQQTAQRNVTRVTAPIRVGTDENWVLAEPVGDDSLEFCYQLEYANPHIGQQRYSAVLDAESFVTEIAPARTFLLKQEAEHLKQKGLGLRVSCRDVLVFDDHGLIDNQLHFANECARHKVLDMIGDLALIGSDLVGRFTGNRSGHLLNATMVFALIQQTNNLIYRRKSA